MSSIAKMTQKRGKNETTVSLQNFRDKTKYTCICKNKTTSNQD